MLRDSYNRPVTNLRVSLTQRCNLQCIYCHAEGEVSPASELAADEIGEILRVAAGLGIKSVKFTGGEPLLRQDLVEIIESVPETMESSMTTNATLLADRAHELKEGGLSRVNISLDSLNPDRYREITGRDCLSQVLEGIDAALDARLAPVKLNMVLIEGMNEDEIPDFLAFVRGNRDLILQLIELMEFNDCKLHGNIDAIESDLANRSREILTRRMHHRKKYCLDGAEVEVVRPLHNTEFCSFCNRLRVTSDGKLKPCLLRNDNLVDVRGRRGAELEELFRTATARRAPFFR
ncbi:MAG: GTP 3',8-cyclase MoaA [Methanomicrobiales archaeon]|nr:GTP 3',8-cyclase MoaA [Methanomicrobiales archaeon]MDI6876408.1 GTP 3',8-cyclase MoaA [Methanomicrobiales archaeon]